VSELDKKLEEICQSFYAGMPASHRQGALQAIKQAFMDNGWEQKVGELRGVRVVVDPNLMTGQEWYDRFIKEFNSNLAGNTYFNEADLRAGLSDVAKKAAGIE
jgi:hypothetical protein